MLQLFFIKKIKCFKNIFPRVLRPFMQKNNDRPKSVVIFWRRRRDSNKLLPSAKSYRFVRHSRIFVFLCRRKSFRSLRLHSQISPAEKDSQNPFLNAVVFSKGSSSLWIKEKATDKSLLLFLWRRRRDSNPRASFEPAYALSRGASSPLEYFSMAAFSLKYSVAFW